MSEYMIYYDLFTLAKIYLSAFCKFGINLCHCITIMSRQCRAFFQVKIVKCFVDDINMFVILAPVLKPGFVGVQVAVFFCFSKSVIMTITIIP